MKYTKQCEYEPCSQEFIGNRMPSRPPNTYCPECNKLRVQWSNIGRIKRNVQIETLKAMKKNHKAIKIAENMDKEI